jgi:hypothetical protein
VQPRQAVDSQIGLDAGQSEGATHSTHPPDPVSQTDVLGNRMHSSELVQPSQTSVVVLQTGAVAGQPAIAQLGTSHWCSTHARPAAQLRTSEIPTSEQSAASRQHTAGLGFVQATRPNNRTQANFIPDPPTGCVISQLSAVPGKCCARARASAVAVTLGARCLGEEPSQGQLTLFRNLADPHGMKCKRPWETVARGLL